MDLFTLETMKRQLDSVLMERYIQRLENLDEFADDFIQTDYTLEDVE